MIFVTGGTGLVGSHLLVELAQNHDHITAIYRNSSKIATVERLFSYYLGEKAADYFKKIKWEPCDVLDVPKLEALLAGHKIVYHCAAIVSFKRRDFSKMMKINRMGTANMVNLSLDLGIEHFCHVSSTAAVGDKDIPLNELVDEEGKWILTDETSGYAISKYSAEKEVWRGIEEGLKAVIVNPSVVIGAGDWKESSMVIFRTIAKGLRFYAPGANAFVDARDVVKIMVSLVDKGITAQRYLCIGENATFLRLFTQIAKRLNKKPPKYKVNYALMSVVWRLSVFWSAITFSSPTVTKSSALSAFNVKKFSNKKVVKELNYTFFTIEDSVDNAVRGRIKQ